MGKCPADHSGRVHDAAPDIVQPAGTRQSVQVGTRLALPLASHGNTRLVDCTGRMRSEPKVVSGQLI